MSKVAGAPFAWAPKQEKWNKSVLNHCLDPSLTDMQPEAELSRQLCSGLDQLNHCQLGDLKQWEPTLVARTKFWSNLLASCCDNRFLIQFYRG